MVNELLEIIGAAKFPVPYEIKVELVRLLALDFTFSSAWPYTRRQMQSALIPGHPDWRPDIPREHVLAAAKEVEKLLIAKLKEEGVSFSDTSQAAMAVLRLIAKTLFGEPQTLGADMHESHFIALVLTRSYQFSPAFPYKTEQIRKVFRKHFDLEPYL